MKRNRTWKRWEGLERWGREESGLYLGRVPRNVLPVQYSMPGASIIAASLALII